MSSEEEFKYLSVAWDRVCLPVEAGGLGIRKIGLFNQALLCKWLWRFRKKVNCLWCQVIASKYGEARGAGALEILEGLMHVVCGRILGLVQRDSLEMWCMRWERAIKFSSSMILGLGLFPKGSLSRFVCVFYV